MKERRGLFEALIVSSVVLHVALVQILPDSRSSRTAFEPSVIEVAELPPKPAPAPVPTSKEQLAPKPTPRSIPRALPVPAAAGPNPKEVEEPADFTSTLLSSADGPGVAIPMAAAATPTTSSARAARAAVPLGPKFVAVANLSKSPRAPGLDRALEKNYPAEARRSGISGSAVLRVRILPDGRVGAVRGVSETYHGFGEACERTLRSAVWEPPIDRDGKPVATEITYICRFEVSTYSKPVEEPVTSSERSASV